MPSLSPRSALALSLAFSQPFGVKAAGGREMGKGYYEGDGSLMPVRGVSAAALQAEYDELNRTVKAARARQDELDLEMTRLEMEERK